MKQESTPTIQVAEKPYRFLTKASKRHAVMYGGAASAKSWQTAIYLVLHKFGRESGVGILCVRKTRPSVKASCYALIKTILSMAGMVSGKHYIENKTELTITSKLTGSWFRFGGLDDPEKIKSIEGINYVWVEEATEISRSDYLQLNLRCRAYNPSGSKNRLYRTFNPVDPAGNKWLKDLTDNPPADTEVLKVTHTDNPFLAQEERDQIENLINEDDQYDKIYRLGEWATPTFIIYNNWDIVDLVPNGYNITYYGIDFGYTSPSAIVKCQTNEEAKDVYISEDVYRTRLTNSDLIEQIKACGITFNDVIVADAAEPDRIEEIRQAGYNIWPASKGQGSLTEGIDRCKRKRLHILDTAINIIEEIQGYKNKVDKDENVLEEPVPFRDHAMDAMRYAIKKLDTDLGIVLGIDFVSPTADDVIHERYVLCTEEFIGETAEEAANREGKEFMDNLENDDMWESI